MFGHGRIATESESAFECGRCGWAGNWPRRIGYQDVRCCPDCGDEVEGAAS
jgi:ribosomal protein S27AE